MSIEPPPGVTARWTVTNDQTFRIEDLQTSALSVLKDNDACALAELTITGQPFRSRPIYTYRSQNCQQLHAMTLTKTSLFDGRDQAEDLLRS